MSDIAKLAIYFKVPNRSMAFMVGVQKGAPLKECAPLVEKCGTESYNVPSIVLELSNSVKKSSQYKN